MVFPNQGKARLTDSQANLAPGTISEADRFPFDLDAMRELVRVSSFEQDDARLTANILGALAYAENMLRVDVLRSAYRAVYDVFPENAGDPFVFTGLNAEPLAARALAAGRPTVEIADFATRPYGRNGAVAVSFVRTSLPRNCDGLEIDGTAGVSKADLPEDLEQATMLAFRYLARGAPHVKEALESVVAPYTLA